MAVQRSRADLSNTPKDFVESRPGSQQPANQKVPLSAGLLDETVKLEQTSAWPDAKACTRAEPLARYKTKVLWHFRFLRPAKVTLGNQLGRRDLGPPVVNDPPH